LRDESMRKSLHNFDAHQRSSAINYARKTNPDNAHG
jgi:hypothetical protein